MTLLTAYKTLYLRLVDWGRKAHGPGDLPEYNALLGLATIATMNVFSVIMLAELAFGKRPLLPNPKITAVVIWIGLAVLHYIFLLPLAQSDQVPRAVIGGTRQTVLIYAIGSSLVFLTLLSTR